MSLTSQRGVVGSFYMGATANPANLWWNQFAWFYNSDQDAETYAMTGAGPQMRQWVGERLADSLRLDKITIVNNDYEGTLDIPLNDWRLDKTGQLAGKAQELGAAATWKHLQREACSMLINGTSASSVYGAAYDGQAFFSASHSIGSSGTYKNLLTSSEVSSLQCATAATPTELEAAQIMLGIANYMRTFNDDKGEPLNEEAMEFALLCAPAKVASFTAAATNAQVILSSSASATNPLKGVNFTVYSSQRLINLGGLTTEIYVSRTDAPVKGMIVQGELDPKMDFLGDGSEFAINNNKVRWAVKARRGFGYGEPRMLCKATMS